MIELFKLTKINLHGFQAIYCFVPFIIIKNICRWECVQMMDSESPMKVVKREESEANAREGSFRHSHASPFGTGAFENISS